MIKFLLLLSTACALLSCASAVTEQEDSARRLSVARSLYYDLTDVRQFYFVHVDLAGSAEEIGLDRKELAEFLRLRFKNFFTGFPLKELPPDKNGSPKDDVVEREWAYLSVTVWTVGSDYPVAYHINLTMRKLRGGGGGYEDASLGYASAKALKSERILKDAISDMMERAAVKLLKIQGKL